MEMGNINQQPPPASSLNKNTSSGGSTINERNIFVIILGIVFLIVIVILGVYLLKNQQDQTTVVKENLSPTTTVMQPSPIVPELASIADDKGATPAGINSVISANNQFALYLYSKLKNNDKNIFFSPYSISTALAMTYEGARGKTANEIQSVFDFPPDSNLRKSAFAAIYNQLNKANSEYKLNIANALWAQNDYKFLNEYLTTLQQYYVGKATNVDFKNSTEESRQIINKWVEDKTNNKIMDLFPQGSLNDRTRLVLTNA